MSLTITKEPTTPCFSKNLIQYKVTTTNDFAVKARIYVEDVPQSGTYAFLTELKQWPDADGISTFNLQGLFEEDVLEYDKPNFFQDAQVQPGICKRFYVKFFEYDPDALTLVEELYHEDSDADKLSYVDITALADSTTYIVVLESEDANTPILRDGASESGMTGLYFLGDEQWYLYANGTGNTYDEIKIPGFTKVTIYEGSAYTLSTSTTTFALLGGYDVQNWFIELEAPVLSAVAVSDTAIDLSWTDVGDFETGFELQISTDGTNFSAETTTGVDELTYSDTGLTEDTTYYYRVRAVRDGFTSEWSEVVSVDTMALLTDVDGTSATDVDGTATIGF